LSVRWMEPKKEHSTECCLVPMLVHSMDCNSVLMMALQLANLSEPWWESW
jgi:hypothetical protein